MEIIQKQANEIESLIDKFIIQYINDNQYNQLRIFSNDEIKILQILLKDELNYTILEDELAEMVHIEAAKLYYKSFEKKFSSDRELPICEDLVKLLKYLRGRYAENKMKFRPNYEDNNLVFGKDDGGFICDTVLRQHFNDRLEELKIPHARLHDLRHTFATTNRKLVPLEDVSKYLGHSSVVTTADMYIHIDRESLRDIANTMNMRFRKEKEDSRKIACEDIDKRPS